MENQINLPTDKGGTNGSPVTVSDPLFFSFFFSFFLVQLPFIVVYLEWVWQYERINKGFIVSKNYNKCQGQLK